MRFPGHLMSNIPSISVVKLCPVASALALLVSRFFSRSGAIQSFPHWRIIFFAYLCVIDNSSTTGQDQTLTNSPFYLHFKYHLNWSKQTKTQAMKKSQTCSSRTSLSSSFSVSRWKPTTLNYISVMMYYVTGTLVTAVNSIDDLIIIDVIGSHITP